VDYGITVTESRGRFSCIHPDKTKPVTGRKLGTDYEKDHIAQFIASKATEVVGQTPNTGAKASAQENIKFTAA